MPIIYTDEFDPATFPQSTVRQIYNGLDCCITSEVLTALRPLSGNAPNVIYDFERALQAPVLEMMQRGFKIDEYERRKGVALLQSQISHLDRWLQELAVAVWGKTLNPRSPKQLIDFFYSAMRLPEQWKNDKGNKRLSTDREALEKLEVYFYARPIVSTILEIRNLLKKLSVLKTEIDPDLRFRPNFNIAGTETGRFSSSSNAFGTASNIQNITAELRKIFVADAGYKLVGIDLEQAESREVGWQCGVLFGDWSYLDAAYSGDLHTIVTQQNWTKLPWGDDPKENKKLAEQPYYRHYSYRDMSKKLGHGSNYGGAPFTMARHAKIPVKMAEDFQVRYFEAFPGISRWHRWVAQQLQQNQLLVTPFGRRRHFFGRPNDDSTLREAIAYTPQSSTADRTNLILYRIWKHMRDRVQLLAQVHDAIYFQFPEHLDEQEIISEAMSYFEIKIEHGERKLIVPGEAKSGWNWASYVSEEDVARWEKDPKGPKPQFNPNGLKKFKGKDSRERLTGLDRIL